MPAELLSYYYTNPDTKVKLQFQIILQCAPLLKGIKVSNIMTMATSSCGILDRITGGNGNHIPDPVLQQGTQSGAFLQKAGTHGTSEKGAGTSLLKRIWI